MFFYVCYALSLDGGKPRQMKCTADSAAIVNKRKLQEPLLHTVIRYQTAAAIVRG